MESEECRDKPCLSGGERFAVQGLVDSGKLSGVSNQGFGVRGEALVRCSTEIFTSVARAISPQNCILALGAGRLPALHRPLREHAVGAGASCTVRLGSQCYYTNAVNAF